MRPIHMQLSRNHKIFSQSFSAFRKCTYNFEDFGKKYEPQMLFVSDIRDSKKRGYLNT